MSYASIAPYMQSNFIRRGGDRFTEGMRPYTGQYTDTMRDWAPFMMGGAGSAIGGAYGGASGRAIGGAIGGGLGGMAFGRGNPYSDAAANAIPWVGGGMGQYAGSAMGGYGRAGQMIGSGLSGGIGGYMKSQSGYPMQDAFKGAMFNMGHQGLSNWLNR